ncbi:MAG TPA: alanine racemase, partial [Longimicrobiales bacterium]|nr:alanine racemase [Longimicrobiales bacterium]
PALGPRAAAIARVAASTPTLIAVDSVEAVEAIRGAMDADPDAETIGVLVEVDLGMRRMGVSDAAAAAEVARACGGSVAYRGITFYPGHVRDPVPDQDEGLESLAAALDGIVTALGDEGLAPEIVSGGSTPTALRSHELPHVTEIRPGTYVYNDRTTEGIGACERDHLAYTVLATVISTAVPGQAVVDAGSKALSSDPIRAPEKEGFGEMLDRPGVTVTRMSEEHGILDLSATDWRPKVGDRVRIVPNHVCVSVNLHPVMYGVRGWSVERTWRIEPRGWEIPEG